MFFILSRKESNEIEGILGFFSSFYLISELMSSLYEDSEDETYEDDDDDICLFTFYLDLLLLLS